MARLSSEKLSALQSATDAITGFQASGRKRPNAVERRASETYRSIVSGTKKDPLYQSTSNVRRINRAMQRGAGSLTEARGHGETPERPTQKIGKDAKARYRRYLTGKAPGPMRLVLANVTVIEVEGLRGNDRSLVGSHLNLIGKVPDISPAISEPAVDSLQSGSWVVGGYNGIPVYTLVTDRDTINKMAFDGRLPTNTAYPTTKGP